MEILLGIRAMIIDLLPCKARSRQRALRTDAGLPVRLEPLLMHLYFFRPGRFNLRRLFLRFVIFDRLRNAQRYILRFRLKQAIDNHRFAHACGQLHMLLLRKLSQLHNGLAVQGLIIHSLPPENY